MSDKPNIPTRHQFLSTTLERTRTTKCNYTSHQNGKVEGEAIGNLDRILELNTIHIGTDTTEQVQGVP